MRNVVSKPFDPSSNGARIFIKIMAGIVVFLSSEVKKLKLSMKNQSYAHAELLEMLKRVNHWKERLLVLV
jgi:hypothetical protein